MSYLLDDLPSKLQEVILTEIVKYTINFVYLHPINFNLRWIPLNSVDSIIISNNINKLKLQDFITRKWEIPSMIDFDFNVLPYWKLHASTNQTGDPFRSSIAKFKLPKEEFEWSTERKGGLNLRDITEAAYRLKGSKYDYENEQLNRIEIVDVNDKNIHLRFEFQYQKPQLGGKLNIDYQSDDD